MARLSPKKIYSGVKSKVAGNLQSQKRSVTGKGVITHPTRSTLGIVARTSPSAAKVTKQTTSSSKAFGGAYTSPNVKKFDSMRRTSSSSMQKSAKSFKPLDRSSSKKSTQAADPNVSEKTMQQIIEGIKTRYSKELILKMSQEELQAEVLKELQQNQAMAKQPSKSTVKRPASSKSTSYTGSRRSTGLTKSSVAKKPPSRIEVETPDNVMVNDLDYQNSVEMKHDRSRQLLASSKKQFITPNVKRGPVYAKTAAAVKNPK